MHPRDDQRRWRDYLLYGPGLFLQVRPRKSAHIAQNRSKGTTATLGDRTSTPLCQLASTRDVARQHTTRWVCQPDLRPSLALLFQIFPNTRKGASGPCGTHESIYFAFRLRPNFRTSRDVVRVCVRCIVELVSPDRIGRGLCVVASLMVVVCWVVVCDCRDRVDLGTEHAE